MGLRGCKVGRASLCVAGVHNAGTSCNWMFHRIGQTYFASLFAWWCDMTSTGSQVMTHTGQSHNPDALHAVRLTGLPHEPPCPSSPTRPLVGKLAQAFQTLLFPNFHVQDPTSRSS